MNRKNQKRGADKTSAPKDFVKKKNVSVQKIVTSSAPSENDVKAQDAITAIKYTPLDQKKQVRPVKKNDEFLGGPKGGKGNMTSKQKGKGKGKSKRKGKRKSKNKGEGMSKGKNQSKVKYLVSAKGNTGKGSKEEARGGKIKGRPQRKSRPWTTRWRTCSQSYWKEQRRRTCSRCLSLRIPSAAFTCTTILL